MEIIHIALGKVNPQRMNGVNKVVYNLATEQAKAGMHVSVWGISSSIEHNYPERNFKTIIFKKAFFPFSLPAGFEEAVLSTSEDTVFHIHGGFIPVFYSISGILKKLDRKIIFTPHGSYNKIAWRKSYYLKSAYFRLFEQKMLNRVSVIHVLGKSETDGLNALSSGHEIQRIPYGFELNSELKTTASDNFEFIIGFCGRIDIYTKGLDVLIDGFAQFLSINKDARLWIIGDGSQKQELIERAVGLGIAQNCVFWGSKFGDEKDNLIVQMNLFAHPSRNEGLPTAVLEAASLGVPCMITEATNLGEEVKSAGSGVVIPAADALAVAAAFKQVYFTSKSDGLNELKNKSQEMVANYFNWSDILKQFDSIYNRALSLK
ncbi:MAG: glycosyltransferase family 4 protein [Bacteroidia bacterium]